MAQAANIIAFDGASTPASHTFFPDSVARDKNVTTAAYKELVAAVPDVAQGRVSIKRTKLNNGVNRVSVRVELPVMEATNGANSAGYTAPPKVAHVPTVEVVGFFHERSTALERRTVRQLAINIMGNVATSVAAAQSGPSPDLFDGLLTPT
jgi:hypothetical protein